MRPLGLIFLFAGAAWAQLATDGITVNVGRNVTIAPDEADFSVVATTVLDTTQQQVIQVFTDAGIQNASVVNLAVGQANFTYPPSTDSQMFFQVTFTTSPTAFAAVAKKLDALRNNLPTVLAGLQYTAVLNPSQAAIDAARQTAIPQLLSDAKARAATLAAASSLTLGNVVAISDSGYATGGILNSVVGSSGSGVYSSNTTTGAGTQYVFNATVKFSAQ